MLLLPCPLRSRAEVSLPEGAMAGGPFAQFQLPARTRCAATCIGMPSQRRPSIWKGDRLSVYDSLQKRGKAGKAFVVAAGRLPRFVSQTYLSNIDIRRINQTYQSNAPGRFQWRSTSASLFTSQGRPVSDIHQLHCRLFCKVIPRAVFQGSPLSRVPEGKWLKHVCTTPHSVVPL